MHDVMNREWIGLAEDITEQSVIGRPHQITQKQERETTLSPPASYPAPPRNGTTKTVLLLAATLAGVIAFTPVGREFIEVVKGYTAGTASLPQPAPAPDSTVPGRQPDSSPNISSFASSAQTSPPSAAAVRKQDGQTSEKKKPDAERPQREKSKPPAGRQEEHAPADNPATDSEIDITRFRNLSGRT